ncbi:MAG: PRC-barrel domain-containing protein, partial [Duncaniella sp.]|nr:PRC-barrel domain-containing protein [Duncaniella sp.]
DLPEPEELDPAADGFYASDFIGFEVSDLDLGPLGTITDINDATENVLFVITRPDGTELLVPVVDEFIDEIDVAARRLVTAVPEGIIDLN